MHLCTIVLFQKGVVAMNGAIVYVHGHAGGQKGAAHLADITG